MAAKIIDALVVTLGLDFSQLEKEGGRAKKQQKDFAHDVKKGGNEITDSLMNVTKQIGTMLLGFEGIKGAISTFAGLNVELADLGRFSKNLGQNVHEINAWDQAIELAGGTASDAQADLQNLSNSITQLSTTGTASPLLMLFSRLGISLHDSQGKVKKLTDLYKEMGDKLQHFNRADAFNLARQAGLSQSTFNLISMEAKKREEILRTAEANNNATEASTRQAAELQKSWRELGQEAKAFEQTILTKISPAIQSMLRHVINFTSELMHSGDAANRIKAFFQPIADLTKLIVSGWSQLIDLINNAANGNGPFNKLIVGLGWLFDKLHVLAGGESVGSVDSLVDSNKQVARSLSGNNPGNVRFRGQAGATSDENGFAVFKSFSDGLKAANDQLDKLSKSGFNTIGDIIKQWRPLDDDTKLNEYIDNVSRHLGKKANDQLNSSERQRLLQDIYSGQSFNNGAFGAIQIGSAAQSPGVRNTNNSSSSTNVQIDNITVNTQATDAHGVASELPPALRRKGVVAQANTGQS